MPRAKKVVSLAEREKEKTLRQAAAFAAGMVREDPTPEVRAAVDAEFDADPEMRRRFGDLHGDALDLAFKDFYLGYVTKEAVRRGAEELRRELGFEEATPAERVMIEHAVLCHVRLGMVEHLYSRNTSGSYNIKQAEHFEKRLTLAQKRFTRAVTTLANVRALLARAEAASQAAAKARGTHALAVLKQMSG